VKKKTRFSKLVNKETEQRAETKEATKEDNKRSRNPVGKKRKT